MIRKALTNEGLAVFALGFLLGGVIFAIIAFCVFIAAISGDLGVVKSILFIAGILFVGWTLYKH